MLGTENSLRVRDWFSNDIKLPSDVSFKNLWLCIVAILFLVSSLPMNQLAAQNVQVQDAEIRDKPLKAAYLYNFAKYIQVSAEYERTIPNGDRNIVIGIVGNSEVESHLQTIANRKTINGKTLVVKKFENADSISACHILFISSSLDAQTLNQVLLKTNETFAYVVADTTQSLDSIHSGFYYEDNKIKFAINVDRVEQKGIRLSSNLLRLGKLVRTQPQVAQPTEQYRSYFPNSSPSTNQQSAPTPFPSTPNRNFSPQSFPPATGSGDQLRSVSPPKELPPQIQSPKTGESATDVSDARFSSRRRQ